MATSTGLLASSASLDGIIKLIEKYYCSNEIKLTQINEKQWSISNGTKQITNTIVILKNKRFRLQYSN